MTNDHLAEIASLDVSRTQCETLYGVTGCKIVEHLNHARRRDIEKGGDGTRSTVEIAERLGVKTATARRVLESLNYAGVVEWHGAIEGLGNVHYWSRP